MKKLLALDDFYLLHDHNLRRVMIAPQWDYTNACPLPDYPAGARFFSVVPSPRGGYDMVLSTFDPAYPVGMQTGALTIALAHSEDGLTFRPVQKLGPGGEHGLGVAVFHDPRDAEYPYKAIEADIFHRQADGESVSGTSYCVGSSDLIHWGRCSEEEIIPNSCLDCQPGVVYNPHAGKYQLTLRRAHGDRRISLIESEDCRCWSSPRCILHPGTPLDEPGTHFYSMPHFYSAHSDVFIGFLWKLHMPYNEVSSGPMTTELVYSYDGTIWNRTLHTLMPVDHPFCQAGSAPAGAPLACAWLMSMIEKEDEVLLYAMAGDYEHQRVPAPGQEFYRTHVARMRPDGFSCYRAGEKEGEALTLWLKPREDTRLFLNYKTHMHGQVRAALLGGNGQPIKGFDLDDCLLDEGDFIHQEIRWTGGTWQDCVAEHPWVRLRIRLKNAEFYSVGGDFYAVVNNEGILYDRP